MGDGPRGALLIHGFTGAPGELRNLGEALAAAGWRVDAPLLPGHGTRIQDLEACRVEDWFRAVDEALTQMRAQTGRPVAVVGLSMGALLGLWLAATRPDDVSAVVALSLPLQIPSRRARFLIALLNGTRLSRLVRFISKGPTGLDPAVDAARFVYSRWTVRGLGQLARLMRIVRHELHEVRAPLLAIFGGKDTTAPPSNGDLLLARVSSSVSEKHVLPESGHVLPLDRDAGRVAELTLAFLGAHSS